MNAELDDVRRKVWIGNRALHRLGLATGITAGLGHCSMRLPSDPDRFMVKGREMEVDALAVLRQDDIITCNLDGYMVDGKPGLTQVSEVMIHACIYKLRPDVQSVVHVHPRFTVLLSTLNVADDAQRQLWQRAGAATPARLPAHEDDSERSGGHGGRYHAGRQARRPAQGPRRRHGRQQRLAVRHGHGPARGAGAGQLLRLLR